MQTSGVVPKSLSESAFLIERCTIRPTLNQLVSHDGRVTHLEPKVMQLLVFLAERPDEVLPRETLLNAIWGDAFVSEQVLTNAISQIRQSLGEAGRDYLQTIPKRGYRLTARVFPESSQTFLNLRGPQAEAPSNSDVSGKWRRWSRWAGIFIALCLGAVAIVNYTRQPSPAKKTGGGGPEIAIAVLPFQNLGSDKDKDYLRFALSGRIATLLTYSPSLYVRPSADTQKYGTGKVDLQLAGRELRVSRIVTGEFQYEGNSLHIAVELVDVGRNRVAWRSTVIAPAQSSLDLDRQVTLLVHEQLLSALQVEARPESTHPTNAEAYDLYLRSLSFSSDPIPNKEAIRLLDRAVILDPNYAPSWERLGFRSYADSRFSGGGEAAFDRAVMAQEQSVKLDPNLLLNSSALVAYRTERGDLNKALIEAQELVRRFPNYAHSSYALSYVLRYAGLNEEAAQLCDRALALERTKSPFRSCFSPYYRLGDYEKAAQVIRERSPGRQWAYFYLGKIYLSQGDQPLALQNFKQVHDYRGRFMTACMTGNLTKRTADEFESYATDNDPELMWDSAELLAYCGETDRAVRLIRSGIAHNWCGYPFIEREPLLANLRARPEYSELRAAAITCQQNFLRFRNSLNQK